MGKSEEFPSSSKEPEVEILESSRVVEEESSAAARPEKQEQESEDWKKLYEETREKLLWTAADLDNLRKRSLKEKEDYLKYALAGLLKELLPVVDSLDRALQVQGEGNAAALKEGVALTLRQLRSVLEQKGLKPIATVGETFDPHVHEVLLQEEREDVDRETVVEELRAGYLLHDRVLRPAQVKIAKPKARSEEPRGRTEQA